MLLGARLGMSGGAAPLPYDYLVEWIRSDGTAYIDINLDKSYNASLMNVEELSAELNIRREGVDAIQTITAYHPVSNFRMGVMSSTNKTTIGVIQTAVKTMSVPCDSGTNAIDNFSMKAWTDETTVHLSASIDGEVIKSSDLGRATSASTLMTTDRVTIFAFYAKNNMPPMYTQFFTKSELKHLVIKSSTLGLDLDLRPCVKDGVGYLYDSVSGELLGNTAGEGELVFGDRIS